MPTPGMKEIQERIGREPFSGALTERYLHDAIDPSRSSSITLRADLKLWVQKQGITARSAVTAVDNSLVRAYAHRPYLQAWRKRVNPGFDLLREDEDETFELAQPPAASPPPNGAAAPTVEMDQVIELVNKAIDSRFSNISLSDRTKDEVKAIADLAASITANAILAEKLPPRQIEVKNIDKGITVNIGVQHHKFDTLLRVVGAKNHQGYSPNIWLTGVTGSGKTTAAQMLAKALDVPFELEGGLDAAYKLLGHLTPDGKYVETAFFRRFTQGGVMLLDEIDSYSPGALLAMNAALANNFCQFPHGLFERHKDFICLAAGNTWGLGATNDYTGRTKIDAATLNRFGAKIHWDLDEKLERHVAVNMDPVVGIQWHEIILRARAAARKNGLKIMISPRDTFSGISFLQQGFTTNEVLDMTILAGLAPEQADALGLRERETSGEVTRDQMLETIKHELRMGNKITAIKLHREAFGTDLREAKDACEALEEELV